MNSIGPSDEDFAYERHHNQVSHCLGQSDVATGISNACKNPTVAFVVVTTATAAVAGGVLGGPPGCGTGCVFGCLGGAAVAAIYHKRGEIGSCVEQGLVNCGNGILRFTDFVRREEEENSNELSDTVMGVLKYVGIVKDFVPMSRRLRRQ